MMRIVIRDTGLRVNVDSKPVVVRVTSSGPQGTPGKDATGAGGVELDPVAAAALQAHMNDPQYHPTPLVRPSLALIYAAAKI